MRLKAIKGRGCSSFRLPSVQLPGSSSRLLLRIGSLGTHYPNLDAAVRRNLDCRGGVAMPTQEIAHGFIDDICWIGDARRLCERGRDMAGGQSTSDT